MPDYDFHTPRLFTNFGLGDGASLALDREQINYLINVLRLRSGDAVLVFNGRDGEWRAEIAQPGRKSAILIVGEQTRAQTQASNVHYLFAPLKHARLDYMVQKAVELGASLLQPVLTRHTQVERINLGRMHANAVEAAEQCGILNVAEIGEPKKFMDLVRFWPATRLLVFCDEHAEVADPIAALAGARSQNANGDDSAAVLVGPEGGFAPEEREALLALPRVARLTLGPRILRADTAAIAALTLVQAMLGDWRPR